MIKRKESDTSIGINLILNPGFRKRFFFLLGALIIFRIGAHVPVPGVDASALADLYQRNASTGILNMFNMFSGGSLERFSVFAIGIMPYISASIVMQLAAEIIPSLKGLKKDGDAGRKVITRYTRVGTVLLAGIQSIGAASFVLSQGIVVISRFEFYVSTMACLVGGTMFLMWLGEQITERGIGNGISLLISAGIISGILVSLIQLSSLVVNRPLFAILLAAGILLLTYLIVFFESGLRKVPIHYAKRFIGSGVLGVKGNSHLPFKLNMAGVIPPIFASSIIMLPTLFLSSFPNQNNAILGHLLSLVQHGQPVYLILFSIAIVFFCYFYTALAFNPKEMADNLKKGGAFIPGIRPGTQTALYIEGVILHLTLFGAIYITTICLIPELLSAIMSLPFYFGGTSLLILIVVIMDFRVQIMSYKLTQQYESLVSSNLIN